MSDSFMRHDTAVGWRMAGGLTILLVVALGSTAVMAQRDFSKVEVKTTDLGDGLMMLQGAGGNIGVSTGKDGVFLIDDQFAPLAEKILPAIPEAAWPVITFEDGVTLHLNGQTIEAIHVAPMHTDGDSIVYFHEADVLHMGDTYFSGMYPYIDWLSGGALGGMIAATNRGLAIAGLATRIIPGHGPLSNRAEFEATRNMLVSIRDRVLKLIESGQSRDQVIAGKPAQGTTRSGAADSSSPMSSPRPPTTA